MEVWLVIVIIVVLVVIMEIRRDELRERNNKRRRELEDRVRNLSFRETSQQTRQRGTPEQERGSDDTG